MIEKLKQQEQDKMSELIKECKVFFAFDDAQFQKNKTPLEEGEKHISIGMGGFMPKGQIERWEEGMAAIDTWFKSAVSDDKMRKEHIAYELANHEAYYTCDIESTMDALGEDYTAAEVWDVYRKNKRDYQD